MFYSVFGLHLFSNRSIPGLVISTPGPVDIRIWFNEKPSWLDEAHESLGVPWYTSTYYNARGTPMLTAWKINSSLYLRLKYFDGTEFIVDQAGTEIWANWPEPLTLEDTAIYLLGPILGLVLRLRGIISLHASAIAVGDHAIAFLGQGGAGKSTTAAYFAGLGYPILSDDMVTIIDQGENFLIQPGYPLLRLWPDSANILYGAKRVLPCLTPNWDKRFLDLTQDGYQFQQQPLSLAAIYHLDERSTSSDRPLIEDIPSAESLITLVKNTYLNYLLDKTMRAQEFELLGRIMASVPLRRVKPHTDSSYLSKLCDVILEDFHILTTSGYAKTKRR